MHYRTLGRTGWQVSEISFGAWAIGGAWGAVDDAESLDALRRSLDLGVNFIDTADVYGDGRSEQLIGRVLKERSNQRIYVASKAGRRLPQQVPEGYSRAHLTSLLDQLAARYGVEAFRLASLADPDHLLLERRAAFGPWRPWRRPPHQRCAERGQE